MVTALSIILGVGHLLNSSKEAEVENSRRKEGTQEVEGRRSQVKSRLPFQPVAYPDIE